MQPRISIAVPAYNAEATLAETVASVHAQTFSEWELVICDDGSTDGTAALAEELMAMDSRIVVIHQENRGSGGAYNTAVNAARADLVVMLSSDDLLLSRHLEVLVGVADASPECAIFTCDGYYEYPDGTRERVHSNARWQDPSRCSLAELLFGSLFGVGAAFRRDVHATVGGFREDTYAEDYAFWLKAMALGYSHCHVDEPLSVHRRSRHQKSSNAVAMRESDVHVISDLITSGLLPPAEQRLAEVSLSRLKRNVRIRKAGSALFGPAFTERIIALLRGNR